MEFGIIDAMRTVEQRVYHKHFSVIHFSVF
jgi:hypothetical protein